MKTNHKSRKEAIQMFAFFLKKNVAHYHGMSRKRVIKIVTSELRSCGYYTSPRYYIESTSVYYEGGYLKEWNGRGGFSKNVLSYWEFVYNFRFSF